MVIWRLPRYLAIFFMSLISSITFAQQAGSIRGSVNDKDFDAPLAAAQVTISETGQKVMSTNEGNYVFPQVEAGSYTLVFSKDGYARQVKPNVVVTSGQLTEVDGSLAGEVTEMEEFVVQDVQIASGTEAALLQLRAESPALMDSISAAIMSQAGASDAASALKLVSGATVQDGKYAVVRGLPDRYVNSQLNGVRLPTADTDKRAVELDLFPSAAIESIQVSKTFTPDQQGDASGGAVNLVLKGIPDETSFKIEGQSGYKTNVTGQSDFLSYDGGGVNFFGFDDGDRDIQTGRIGKSWKGAAGVTPESGPVDYKWSMSGGTKYQFGNGIKIGGFGSFFYERESALYTNGKDDKYWVEKPGDPMTPQYSQGTPTQGDFRTALFDVTKGVDEVRWGGLGTVGVESKNNSISLTYLYTRVAEDVATLAQDTRGKDYYFPGYNPNDPMAPGNLARFAAPYLRTETLQYTERTAQTLQLHGHHKAPIPELHLSKYFTVLQPEFDWRVSHSSATLNQPDKTQFGSMWLPETFNPGFPPYVPPSTYPPEWRPFKPAANFTIGNLQRIWKDISEESHQYALDLKLPFKQWTDTEGYMKFGVFKDTVNREYNQDSFSNFNDNAAQFPGWFDDFWSEHFPFEHHPITPADIDVDYQGEQKISAWYSMMDLPLTSWLKFIGGARYETTELSIINTPEKDVTWFPPGALGAIKLNPGEADVAFRQKDFLPSIGFVLTPLKPVTIRGSYSRTIARQTFKELTPIQQQEFLGGDVFIGNPLLQMSAVKNYDLRIDYTPFQGGLLSASYFYKNITNPIEYVQRLVDFAYTTPVNYPNGKISGFEVEARQDLGYVWKPLAGLTLGGNATFIDSEVILPPDEAAIFEQASVKAPMTKRDMTNAPNHLYNLYMIYDFDNLKFKPLNGTQLNVFYTVRGDTLVAGAGESKGFFIPNVYEKEYGTLNLSVIKKFGDSFSLKFQAKNLLDPMIETVYRSEFIDKDVTKTSYQKGMEFTLGFTYVFKPRKKS